MPNSVTINETETTNEIIFVRFDRDVDTDQFTLCCCTSLLNGERLAVSRKTCDEDRIELVRGDNFAKIAEVTKRDIGTIFLGNVGLGRDSSRCFISTLDFLGSEIPLAPTRFIRLKALTSGSVGYAQRICYIANLNSVNFNTVQFSQLIDKVCSGDVRLCLLYTSPSPRDS